MKRYLGQILSAGVALTLAAGSYGADAPPSDTTDSTPSSAAAELPEVMVTAQKRSERLDDVPLSITALSADQMSKEGIDDIADLQKVVPGFSYRLSQNGTPILQIRGIGFYDEQVAVSPTVTVYVDQIPLPYARMTEGAALDLERVEVLKGPQGTLFGQNSTAGAINYIAAKPTSAFAAGADLDYGRFNAVTVGGFVSGPLAETVTARFAFKSETRGDWQYNRDDTDTLGRKDFQTARLLLDWKPVEALKVEFNLNGWLDKSDTQMSQAREYLPVSPLPPLTPVTARTAAELTNYPYLTNNNNRAADWNAGVDFARDDHFFQTAMRADYALSESLKIVSITSYANLVVFDPIDGDGTDVQALLIHQSGSLSSASQELRLEGNSDRVDWIVGGNYQRDRNREIQYSLIDGSNAQAPTPAGTFVHFDGLDLLNYQQIRTAAAFANATLKFSDQWSVQSAVRYTSQDFGFSGCLADNGTPTGFRLAEPGVPPFGCATLLPSGAPGLYTTALDQDNVSWRGSLNWKPNADSLLYANVTKGFKSGSFGTLPAVSYQQFKPVSQESVIAYETGFKTSFDNRRFDVSGATFYYDYDNKQIQGYVVVPPFGNLPYLVNVPKSRIAGTEFQVTAVPLEGLRTTLGGTYLSTKVKGTALVGSPFGTIVNADGEALPATPKWQGVADAEYDFPLGDLTAFVGANYSYQTESVAAFGATTGPAGSEDWFNIRGYGLLGARAGVSIHDKYRIQLYGENITDTNYWNNVTHIYDTVDRIYGFPATFGVRASARF
jgi:iron complex outermembrane recepter protein